MSDVKQRVVRIVNGLPPIEPKNLVEVKSDEIVVKAASLAAHSAPESDPTGFSDETPVQGGNVPPETVYNCEPDGREKFSTGKGTVSPLMFTQWAGRLKRKPYVKFRMLPDSKQAYIEPQDGFWPYPLPKIVLQ